MQALVQQIEKIKKSAIKTVIDTRIEQFEKLGKEKADKVFSELCFCIMTANFQAEKCIRIQEEIGRDFLYLSKEKIAEKLKEFGHRFPNTRANYIDEARKCKDELCKVLSPDASKMREWLVKNIKGLGYKEASHFLRNIGYKDVAIIDFHILDLLFRHKLIENTADKNLTKEKYLEIENILKKLANQVGLSLAELDLYLWYLETGKVLK